MILVSSDMADNIRSAASTPGAVFTMNWPGMISASMSEGKVGSCACAMPAARNTRGAHMLRRIFISNTPWKLKSGAARRRRAAGVAQQPIVSQSFLILSEVKRGPLNVWPKLPVQLVPS